MYCMNMQRGCKPEAFLSQGKLVQRYGVLSNRIAAPKKSLSNAVLFNEVVKFGFEIVDFWA